MINDHHDWMKFKQLEESSCDFKCDAEWDDYYQAMAPLLQHSDPSIRASAVERLAMAVMRAEKMSYWQRQPSARITVERSVEKLNWLLTCVNDAHQKFHDVGPAFLHELQHHGDDEPYAQPLRQWLHTWLEHPPDNVSIDLIRGSLILLGDCGADWTESAPRWLQYLDDPSNYVRACAAKMLGEQCDEDTSPGPDALFKLIQAKEIIRPGIAGPFWSGFQNARSGLSDPTEWMMEILEKRQGDEPPELPFNGIEFYLHELCDGSLDAIDRMLKLGHKALALETATETRGEIEGMKEVLLKLGDDPSRAIAQGAWEHLARYYHTLHSRAGETQAIRLKSDWHSRADVFTLRQGHSETWRDVVVVYPSMTNTHFRDEEVWSLIDTILPKKLRGEVGHYFLAPRGEIGPYYSGKYLLYEFTSGVLLTYEGDPEKKMWQRVEIIGRGLQGQWDPWLILND